MSRLHFGEIDAEGLILAAWSAIAIGAALNYGFYSTPSIIFVSLGSIMLVVATGLRARPLQRSDRDLDWGLPVGAVVFTALVLPATSVEEITGFQLDLSHTLTAVAAIVFAAFFVFRRSIPRLFAYVLIAVMVGAAIVMVRADPNPLIDVWRSLQAADHGLSHGQSIYDLHWFAPPGQDSNSFAYLPGCAILLWPFYMLFGDVRYGELFALVLTSVVLTRARGAKIGPVLGCLVLLYPGSVYGIAHAWVDPLVVLEVAAAAYACTRERKGLAVLAFAAALVTKQQAWLLVPLAAVWVPFGWRRTVTAVGGAVAFLLPWYLVAPSGFVRGVFLYNLRLPARTDSLSLFSTAILHGWHPFFGLVGIATLAAIAFALVRGARDTQGFLVGSAMVEAVFNLSNTDSFFNEWELAAGFALLAFVFSRVDDATPSRIARLDDAGRGDRRRRRHAAQRTSPDRPGLWRDRYQRLGRRL